MRALSKTLRSINWPPVVSGALVLGAVVFGAVGVVKLLGDGWTYLYLAVTSLAVAVLIARGARG